MRNCAVSLEEMTDWLNAVVDAQVQLSWEDWPAGAEAADECWGFFSEWREMLKWAAWDLMME